MRKIRNNKKEEVLLESNVSNEDQACSCISSTWNFSDNFIAIGLLISAVCISFSRYIIAKTPTVTFTHELSNNNIEDCANDEDIELTNIDDTEFEDSEEWENDEKLLTDEDVKNINELVTFGVGDTLAKILEKCNINKSDVHEASVAVSRVFHLKKIKPGLQISIEKDSNDKTSLKCLKFRPDRRFKVIVEKHNKRFIAKKVTVPLKRVVKKISGSISPKAPVLSLQKCGAQKTIANDAIKALNHVVGLNKLKSPVKFDLKYEQHCDELGNVVDSNLLAIAASVDGNLKKIYKFSINGSMQYVDTNGMILSVKKEGAMFIKPIAYKKITSQFGYRYHPISGRRKMHTGVDLSASIGTPVRATASGHVVVAQNRRGYGRYIKIRHSGNYSTAYAHLSRMIVSIGQYVTQGQIIAYSGNSGYSTGSHLHYECMQNGKFINPLAFVPQAPQRLLKKDLVKFNTFKRSINL